MCDHADASPVLEQPLIGIKTAAAAKACKGKLNSPAGSRVEG
jgi:hypothetical protein